MNISRTQKAYIDKKVNRLRRLCPKIDEMHFTLTREKLHYKADVTFRAGAIAAQANSTASQPLEAIDLLVDKLEAQITKTKARWGNKKALGRERQRAGEAAVLEETLATDAALDDEDEEEALEDEEEPQRVYA